MAAAAGSDGRLKAPGCGERCDVLGLAQRIARLGSWELEVASGTVRLSEQLRELLGATEESMPLERLADRVAPSERAAFTALFGDWRGSEPRLIQLSVAGYPTRWFAATSPVARDRDGGGRALQLFGTLQDVTERHSAEELVRKLSQAVEQSPSSVVITDLAGRIEYVNPTFSEVTGYSLEEALGQNPRILKTDRTPPQRHCELWRTLLAGRVWRGEFINRKRNGDYYVEAAAIGPVRDSSGQITHYVAVKSDITEQRRKEESLRASEERFRAISEVATDAIVTLDRLGAISFWNRAAAVMFGIEAGEALGLPFARLLAGGKDAAEALEELEASAQPSARVELLARRADSETFPIEISLARWRQDEQDLRVVVARDVSESKRIERELRDSQESLTERVRERTRELEQLNEALRREVAERRRAEEAARAASSEIERVLENAPGGMRVIDTEYNVVRANESLARITGVAMERIVGSKCYETFPGPHCDSARCTLRRALRGEEVRDLEVEKWRPDGRKLPCQLNATLLRGEDGKLLGIVEDFRDLTDTKRLQSIAEAVVLMNNIGYAFSGIRHELGNPVNALKTTLAVLKKRLGTFTPETVATYVDRALDDVARVEYLLRSLKSFNMFESPVVEPLHVSAFLGKLEGLLEPDMRGRGVRLELEPVAEDLWIEADPRALQQVLLNLATNALDALEGRPDPAVRISARGAEGRVFFEVRDNGCGMNAEALENLFKPFYTTKRQGTGLGMAIVRKTLAKMNGVVEVESEIDRGTTVRLELPRA